MILVESPATALARPDPFTVATDGTVEVQPIVTLTGLPDESRAVAVYCKVAPRAMVSTARSSVTDATAPLNAVALNVTGDATPVTLARKERGPVAGPMKAFVCANPSESLNTRFGLTESPAPSAVNDTGTRTPRPSAAVTRTRSGTGSGTPGTAVWLSPATRVSVVATGCAATRTVSAWPLSSCATMRAVPRAEPPTTCPNALFGTRTRAESSDRHAIGVPGITVSAGPNASAVSDSDWPKNTAVSGVVIATETASNPTPTYVMAVSTGFAPPLVVTVTFCG